MTDFLDEILEPKKRPDNQDRKHCLCVGVRAKSSAEIEAREAEYFATDWLPIPFCREDGTLDRELMANDVKAIKAWGGHDLSMDEYELLTCGESK
jgi:hypothetical protein